MSRKLISSGTKSFGFIPATWKVTRLKSILALAGERNSGDRELLSVYLDKGVIAYSESTGLQVHKPSEDLSNYQNVEIGDFVLNNQQAWRGSVGVSRHRGIISPAYLIYRFTEDVDPIFMNYLLRDCSMVQQYETASRGVGTIQRNIYAPWLLNASIILPPVDEQHRIAAFLDRRCAEIDSTIAETQLTIDEYTKLKQSIITEATTRGVSTEHKLVGSDVTWIDAIPTTWDVVRLKSKFSFGKGLPITKDNLVESGVPVISYGQIHSKLTNGVELQPHLFRYVEEKYLTDNPQSLVHKGDFIFADTSEDFNGCGNAVYVSEEMTLFAGYHTIILFSKEQDDNKYIAYLLQTDMWRSQIRSRVSGVKVFSISRKILGDATIILPPMDEREKIVAYLDKKCAAIDRIIAAKQQLIAEMEVYKKSVIYEYVTGKKEVPACQ